jgi:hypothetical protein
MMALPFDPGLKVEGVADVAATPHPSRDGGPVVKPDGRSFPPPIKASRRHDGKNRQFCAMPAATMAASPTRRAA